MKQRTKLKVILHSSWALLSDNRISYWFPDHVFNSIYCNIWMLGTYKWTEKETDYLFQSY